MPKLVSSRLQRFLMCALPVCALSLLAQRLVLAQRPANALPPSARPAPTDEYFRGEAPYPTATPNVTATPTPTPGGYDPYVPLAQGTPTAQPAGTPAAEPSSSLEEFLGGQSGPVSLKLSEANAGWKSLRVLGTNSESPSTQPHSGGTGAEEEFLWRSLLQSFGGEPGVFLTRGRTVRINGDEHLVVYRAAFPGQQEAMKWMGERAKMIAPAQDGQPSWSQVQRVMRDFLDTVPVRSSLLNTRRIAGFDSIEEFRFENRFARFSDLIEPEFRKSQPRSSRDLPTPPARAPSRAPGTADEAPQRVPVPEAVAQQAASEPLRRLFAAVQRYRADNNDVLPPMNDLAQVQDALSSYLSGSDAWRDPVSGRFFLPNARLSGRRMVHLKPFASSLILFYSEPDRQGQRTAMRLDGLIRRVSPAEWSQLMGTHGVQ